MILYLSIFNSFRVIRCLSQCVSPKISILTTFLFPLGTPLGQSRRTLYERKDKFSACQTPPSTYPSIFNSFSVIRTASAKNRRFHVPQPTFLFALETPLRLSRNMLHGWKDNSMLAKPLAACSYLSQYFPSYTMRKSMRKSKNRYFDHIFVSPGDAPGAITLNVV